MYFIYSLLLGLGFLVLLPRFLLDAVRHGKYVAGFRERLGSLHPLTGNDRPVIWLHCVSVGETQAARPLVRGIRERFPDYLIAVSTTTLTGQNLAREVFKTDVAKVFYFPFDWGWVVRRTLRAINPDAVLIMETELWPGFLRECKKQQIPVAIVNGRLSEQSLRRYRLIRAFMTQVLSSLTLAIMQTEADAERLRLMGMDARKTLVAGNLKFDAGIMPGDDTAVSEFGRRFSLTADSGLILAASTHAPEEVIILNAFREVLARMAPKTEAKPRLIIAPRHPERFTEVADLLKASGLRWARRTSPANSSDGQVEVVLLDSIGELNSIYPLASIVFVGGSVAKTGGHNILEPAAFGAAVITGPHTYNFQLIVETFVKASAIIQLRPMSDSATMAELVRSISELLAHPAKRRELGGLAQGLVNENRGATERTLKSLSGMLSNPANAIERVGSPSANEAPIA